MDRHEACLCKRQLREIHTDDKTIRTCKCLLDFMLILRVVKPDSLLERKCPACNREQPGSQDLRSYLLRACLYVCVCGHPFDVVVGHCWFSINNRRPIVVTFVGQRTGESRPLEVNEKQTQREKEKKKRTETCPVVVVSCGHWPTFLINFFNVISHTQTHNRGQPVGTVTSRPIMSLFSLLNSLKLRI